MSGVVCGPWSVWIQQPRADQSSRKWFLPSRGLSVPGMSPRSQEAENLGQCLGILQNDPDLLPQTDPRWGRNPSKVTGLAPLGPPGTQEAALGVRSGTGVHALTPLLAKGHAGSRSQALARGPATGTCLTLNTRFNSKKVVGLLFCLFV